MIQFLLTFPYKLVVSVVMVYYGDSVNIRMCYMSVYLTIVATLTYNVFSTSSLKLLMINFGKSIKISLTEH